MRSLLFTALVCLPLGLPAYAFAADIGNGPMPRLCVCGEGCQCAAGECPGKCPTSSAFAVADVPPSAVFATPCQSCPGGVCSVPMTRTAQGWQTVATSAPVAGCAACGSSTTTSVTTTTTSAAKHPFLHRIFHPFAGRARAGRGCCGG